MKLKELYIKNYRSFADIHLSEISPSINVLIGKNNSGKSNILKSIAVLQYQTLIDSKDIRLRQSSLSMTYRFDFYQLKKLKVKGRNFETQELLDDFNINTMLFSIDNRESVTLNVLSKETTGTRTGMVSSPLENFASSEPNNLVYFFPSNRKVPEISHSVTKHEVNTLSKDFLFLHARINNLLSENSHRGREFIETVKDIIGFEISSISSEKGKISCYRIEDMPEIPIESMGEGVLNILYLLTLLFSTKGSIFLIEELENDLHPESLKKLIDLIVEKSSQNQFFITTHSHIVLKILGAQKESKIFSVTQEYIDLIPTSKVELINNVPEERRRVLESLGYDLADFDLANRWIIFEESSAEKIVVKYLIPWFAPKLPYGLKSVSSNGAQEIVNKTKALYDLFLFLYLEPQFKERVWVIADGDEVGKTAIQNLKTKFHSWDFSHFINLEKEAIELYYPNEFQDEVKEILNLQDKQKRRSAKRELLEKLIDWIEKNPNKAKNEFEKSASEVIGNLKLIEESI
ncbi:MAG: AAA family ATPase [Leptospira sp.]|nr:AAA family ATPase [Leptospira sp.]